LCDKPDEDKKELSQEEIERLRKIWLPVNRLWDRDIGNLKKKSGKSKSNKKTKNQE